MAPATESTSSPPSPSLTKVALGDQIENTNPDGSSVMSAPPSLPNETISDTVENANQDHSVVTSATEFRTGPNSMIEKASEVDGTMTPAATAQETSQTPLSQLGLETVASFTLFPKLAPELRNMIWSFALCRPRVMKLQYHETIPRAVEPIALLDVCQESREVALKFYDLVKLEPSSLTAPFYFSAENTICLLKDNPSSVHLQPPIFNNKSHPWNTFREKVSVLAVDPLRLYGTPDDLCYAFFPVAQAWKLACAVATFPCLKELIILRRVNFEKRMAKTMGLLSATVAAGRGGLHPRMQSSAFSWRVPPITYLDYEYNDGEDAWLAMRKALLAHTG